MSSHVHAPASDDSLAGAVASATGERVAMCYQCGKCSAGCPVAAEMDYPSSQIIRMLQLRMPEMDEKALRSRSIWLCLTCETCSTRCPKEVEPAKIMEHLRAESMRRGMVHPKAKNILRFHKSFLDAIRQTGRLYEMGLIGAYKMRSGKFMQDVLVAPKLFARGKLKLLPHMIKDRARLTRIFRSSEKEDATK